VGGAAVASGFYLFTICGLCSIFGFATAARGRGRSKWFDFGRSISIEHEHPPPEGRVSFLASLPLADKVVDPSREVLLGA
jgi:hypothetical protein